ncbi:MAG: archaellin/type IV pilin N-terminal domain-containing protein [Nitrososphaera sp.]|jgi:flagellin-like protein
MNADINNTRLHLRRGVAPVIATLLLVAIAVVGGAIVFAYSQNFFSSSQVGGRPTIEAVKILGYDGRDVSQLQDHNGVLLADGSGGTPDSQKLAGEKVLVYIKNDSVQPITVSELRFGGSVYNYVTTTPASVSAIPPGQYAIVSAGAGGQGTELISTSPVAEIKPGQTTSFGLSLSESMKLGRDVQFKLTTNNGAVFVGTVVIGQQSG